MVRVSVPESATNVVSTVSSILFEFGFTEQRAPGRVIVFGTDDEAFEEIDFDYYRMRKVRLSDIIKDRKASMGAQVLALYRYIAKVGGSDDNFGVVMDTMNNTDIDVSL
ncbi:unnamed protein product [Strongylus vulgaris]|uniref:Uncharacterized protein n=1 Tax=Strongylus vulgaris TaxID=40348 RepID=A0A3P7ID75_STRVU|nr:unnamed protein product [Strongylus vulgaris]